MNGLERDLDWSLVRAFLAVAETGSLSAAARATGQSQPTLGRQMRQIEGALEVELFIRQPRGLGLTEQGRALLPFAQRMRDAVQGLALTSAGFQGRLDGPVRITASLVVSHHLLPPILARLRQSDPGISIDLVPSDETENLLFREADIALRMYRPTQLDLITRHLGDLPLCVCAARSYLERRGRPATVDDLWQHDLVGLDKSDLVLREMRTLGYEATREAFAMRCDSPLTNYELMRAGCGVGFAQRGLAEQDDAVDILDLGIALPVLPVWITAPQAMRDTPRIRRVWDALVEGLLPFVS